MLARRELAPFDPITGVTCALAPPDEVLKDTAPNTSFHHTNHSAAHLLSLGSAGRAIRTSRLQLSPNNYHNNGPNAYHSVFNHSKVPRTNLGKCRIILFSVAKTIPGEVIDMRAGEVRPITYEERQRLFASNEIRMQSEFMVKKFFTAFVLDMVGHHARHSDIKKYRNTKDDAGRKNIVNDVIGGLIPHAFNPMNKRYDEALRNGSLPEGAPPNPGEVAKQFIFQEPERYNMFNDVIFNQGENLWSSVKSTATQLKERAA